MIHCDLCTTAVIRRGGGGGFTASIPQPESVMSTVGCFRSSLSMVSLAEQSAPAAGVNFTSQVNYSPGASTAARARSRGRSHLPCPGRSRSPKAHSRPFGDRDGPGGALAHGDVPRSHVAPEASTLPPSFTSISCMAGPHVLSAGCLPRAPPSSAAGAPARTASPIPAKEPQGVFPLSDQ